MTLARCQSWPISWYVFALCFTIALAGTHDECVTASTKDNRFDCSKSGCCKDEGYTCYLKDPSYGECLRDCKKGRHDDDVKDKRTAWSCTTVEKDKITGNIVIKEYGQCGGMLSGQGMTPYDGPTTCQVGCKCVNQSVWISTCLPKKNEVPCGSMEAVRIGKALVTAEFKINSKVEGRRSDGKWHEAKIDVIHEDGTYTVRWKASHYAQKSRIVFDKLRHVDNSKSVDEQIDEEIAELEKGGDASLRDDGLGVLEDLEDDDQDADEDGDENKKEKAASSDEEDAVSSKVLSVGAIYTNRPRSSAAVFGLAVSAGIVTTALVVLVVKRKRRQVVGEYAPMSAQLGLRGANCAATGDAADGHSP